MEMFDKLEDIVNRYEDITAELSNPDVVNDQDRFRKLMKEQNNILPIVTAFTEYKDCKKNIEDSLAMLSEESDEELLELAKEELNESKKRVEELENELKILLLPKDPNDDKDIIVEILTVTDPETERLVKAADKLSAYIKCVEELKAGNSEFRDAAAQTRAALEEYELPEMTYFLETFMPSFSLTLDQLK